jgi:hypothetical protein
MTLLLNSENISLNTQFLVVSTTQIGLIAEFLFELILLKDDIL